MHAHTHIHPHTNPHALAHTHTHSHTVRGSGYLGDDDLLAEDLHGVVDAGGLLFD